MYQRHSREHNQLRRRDLLSQKAFGGKHPRLYSRPLHGRDDSDGAGTQRRAEVLSRYIRGVPQKVGATTYGAYNKAGERRPREGRNPRRCKPRNSGYASAGDGTGKDST